MSKIISFKGQLDMGLQDKINLSTLKGKIGYKINQFKIMQNRPGQITATHIAKIYNKFQSSFSSVVDFTEGDLLAVAYQGDNASTNYAIHEVIIFDNEITNQDMYVSITDPDGGTEPCNYYLELEAFPISDIESTKLTLKALRNVASR